MINKIKELAEKTFDDVIAIRRHIHKRLINRSFTHHSSKECLPLVLQPPELKSMSNIPMVLHFDTLVLHKADMAKNMSRDPDCAGNHKDQ